MDLQNQIGSMDQFLDEIMRSPAGSLQFFIIHCSLFNILHSFFPYTIYVNQELKG
jgi:hypothetical protein